LTTSSAPTVAAPAPLRVTGGNPLILDGVLSQVMGALVGGAFLIGFALALGANNFQIGLLASLPPLGQLMQIPAVFLIRKVGKRKPVALVFAALSRLVWFGIAAVPLILIGGPGMFAAVALLVLLASSLGTVGGIAWVSWMRDLIPQEVMGRFFSRRMMFTNSVALVASVAAGYLVDQMSRGEGVPPEGYSLLFVAGAALGLVGVLVLSRVPEPPATQQVEGNLMDTLKSLGEPLRDRNFRSLMTFSLAWTFVITFAAPFFIVYMLNRIGLPLFQVIIISAVGQIANVLFIQFWGAMADRFSNKSVLGAAGLILVIAILGWTFTTLPERYFFTVPLLFILHIAMGLAMGGIALASGNISMKLSPLGRAETYLAVLGMVNAVAAFISPLIAGILAAFFATKELALTFSWSDAGVLVAIPTINLRGLDFLFLITFILGLYALHRLALVHEEGSVGERVVLDELKEEIFESVRNVASFSSLRQVVTFPLTSVASASRVVRRRNHR
jgi:MFS family permease